MNPTFKIHCDKKHQLESYLVEKGILLDDEAEYLIVENKLNKSNQLVALNCNIYEVINISDILYLEADLTQVFCVLQKQKLMVQYKLYELEERLDPQSFMRVHKSFIVNLKRIHKILPEMNSKFTLVMDNQDRIYVTRTYIKAFKHYFGL